MATTTSETAHPFDRYWEPGAPLRPAPPRIEMSPEWFKARKQTVGRFTIVREWPAPTPYNQLLGDHYWQGDQLADALVDVSRSIGAGPVRRMLEQALDDGIEAVEDPPQELVALFAQLDRKPDWYDEEVIERGRVVLCNTSMFGTAAAYFTGLVLTTQGVAVASATGATGRFARNPVRRQLETTEFFWRVTIPGGVERFSEPFKTAVRVRVMHAYVRRGLRERWGDEHFAHHGNPISNTDMAATAAGFGLTPLLADLNVGVRWSADDREAAMRYWAYIGYVMGVAEEILPVTFDQGVQALDYMLAGAGNGTPWSPDVAQAITNYFRDGFRHAAPVPADSPLARAFADLIAFPGFCALIERQVGDPLSREFLASTPYPPIAIKALAAAVGPAARTIYTATSLLDQRPGRRERQHSNALRGDRFQGAGHRTAEKYADERAVVATRFVDHDTSRAEDFDAQR